MKKPFRIVLKIGEQYVIEEEQKEKNLKQWIDAFEGRKEIEEISIFEHNGITFDLVAHEHRRKIGF